MNGIGGATALVTGAGSARGIGRAFVQELRRRDARRIYATDLAREGVEALAADDASGRIVPLALDVTDEQAVAEAAARSSMSARSTGWSTTLTSAPTALPRRRTPR